MTMNEHTQQYLPQSWRAIAECVDEYEAACGDYACDLRVLASKVPPDFRAEAIAELASVDMEYCSKTSQLKSVEQYVDEFPELKEQAKYIDELIAQEYRTRCSRGEHPALAEYRRRFPDRDVDHIISYEDTRTFNVGSATPGAPDGQPEEPPKTIGRYEVIEKLGSGAFGQVYRCRDHELNRDTAIKIPHHKDGASAECFSGFLHEARGAARLRHPGIVAVLDTGQMADGRGYVVYEYVAGQTLRDRIRSGYNREQAVEWCIGLAEALGYAHAQQVVHRDVSPSNVLLDREGHVRLTDFGLAKVDDEFFREDSGKVLGSLAYISPEQARGDSQWASPQSDIYSLGVILYELLAGKRPFGVERAYSLSDILSQIERRVPSPPRTIDPTIPKVLEDVCLKAMAKDPTGRYTTAGDMAADLRAAMRPVRVSPSWLRPLLTVVTALAALVTCIVGVAWFSHPPQPVANIKGPQPPPPPPTHLFELFTHLDRPGSSVNFVIGRDRRQRLPVLNGDLVLFEATLPQAGYVYLFEYLPGGEVHLLYPPLGKLGRQTKVSEFRYPAKEDHQDMWLPVEANSDNGYGEELILLAFSEKELSEEELLEFQHGDKPEMKLDSRTDFSKIPAEASEATRGVGELASSGTPARVGKKFATHLESRFGYNYRGIIYWHAKD